MSRHEGRNAISLLVERVGRNSAIYLVSAFVAVAVGIASIAVLTRLLEPGEYGNLGIVYIVSSLLAILINAGSLQGTFRWVFGAAGDEEEDVDDDEPDGDGVAFQHRRRALTSGLLLTAAIGLTVVGVVRLFEDPLGGWLLDDREDADLVTLAALTGAATAVWRLTSNVLRIENRPVAYVVSTLSMGLFSLIIASVLVVLGGGVRGAVVGTAIGNGAASALTLVLVRHNLAWSASLGDVLQIMRKGVSMVPLVVSFAVITIADVLMVSRFVPAAEVGLYRVAGRLGGLAMHWTSALNMAWGPLQREPVKAAADELRGRQALLSLSSTYFLLASAWVVVSLSVFARPLVTVAGDDFADAAEILPACALAAVLHGVYIVVYRTVVFPGKREWFIRLAVVAALAFLASSFVLIPVFGAIGGALAVSFGWSVSIVTLLVLNARLGQARLFRWRRVWAGVAAGAAVVSVSMAVHPASPGLDLALLVALWLAYSAALVAAGVVPRGHAEAFRDVLRAQAPSLGTRARLRGRIDRLPPEEQQVLRHVVRDRLTPEAIAQRSGMRREEVHLRAVRALMTLSGAGRPADADARLGRYLLDPMPYADRSEYGKELWAQGLDPLVVTRLADELKVLRRHRRRVL